MRSHKPLIMSATVLACVLVASASFADNTTTQTSVPTTSTTVTSQGTPSTSTTTTTAATTTAPTSTTTTTSAEDVSASSATPVGSLAPPPSNESTLIYNKHRPNNALLITGSALLVGTYVTTAALAGANGPVADKDLYIPVVGPWINIADRTPSTRENNTRDTLLIAGSGVLQGVGVLMAVTSFFVPEKVPAVRISAGNVSMQVTPQAGAGGGGLGAVGTF